jgi:hypothetical protein
MERRVHLTQMRHHIEKRKAVILKKVVLVTFKTQLLPELIDQINVNLNGARDRQIAEDRCVHKALKRLIRSGWIAEIAHQQIPIGALERLEQIPPLIGREAAKEAGRIALVKNPEVSQPFLETPGQGSNSEGGRVLLAPIGAALAQEAGDGSVDVVTQLGQLIPR